MKAEQITKIVKENVEYLDKDYNRKCDWRELVDVLEYEVEQNNLTSEEEDKFWKVAVNVWTVFYKRPY